MAESADGKRGMKDKILHPFNHALSEKLQDVQDKLDKTSLGKVHEKAVNAKHKVGKLHNLVNANHRHDEEHEQKTDEKRTKICDGHRFQSFAPERDGNLVKWYIDGRDYFWASSFAILRC